MTHKMESRPESVAALIERARMGSGSGLGELLDIFQPAMLEAADRGIRPALRCRMSGSDLVQDTMLTASQRFHGFRGHTEEELRDWLMTILRSRLVDGLRRHRLAGLRRQQAEVRLTGSQFVDHAVSPSQQASLDEDAARLLAAIQQLPDLLRETVCRRYIEDLTFEEIADIQQVSVATVWRRWADAVDILKRYV